jgi:hypothetical protein
LPSGRPFVFMAQTPYFAVFHHRKSAKCRH